MKTAIAFAVLLSATAHAQESKSVRAELVAASDAAAPKSLAAISEGSANAVKVFGSVKMGAGFSSEQRVWLRGLYLLCPDTKTAAKLNAAAPGNFRLPVMATERGEAVLPFDLLTDPINYKWCHEALCLMPIIARDPVKDFQAPKLMVMPRTNSAPSGTGKNN
jgi:hypothetical protein